MRQNASLDTEERWSRNLRALASILWAQSDRVLVTTRSDSPPTHREIESYLVVPSVQRARFLVPLHSGRQSAAATLRAYNGLRPRKRRISRGALATVVQAGMGRAVPGTRLRVLVDREVGESDLSSHLLVAALSDLLAADRLVAAFGVPPETPNAKPTLQLFTAGGRPAGYAKLSWSDSSRTQVRNEARAAQRFGPALTRVHVPRLLAASTWQGSDIAITEPLPSDVVAWRAPHPPPLDVTDEIAGVQGIENKPIADSALLQRTGGDNPQIEPALARALCAARRTVADRVGAHVLRFGSWHGDWTPWNLARSGATTFAWDWEHSSDDVPVGLDILHWYFQLAFIGRRLPLAASVADAAQRSRAALVELQGDDRAALACTALYILELAARYGIQQAAGRGWAHGFYPAILSVLDDLPLS